MSTLQQTDRAPHRSWRGIDASDRIAARRERLFDAGLEVFAAGGYANATVQKICGEAGLTQRYFYESFSNKDDLLAGLIDQIGDDAFAAASLGVGDLDRGVNQVARDGLAALLESLVGDPRRGQVLLVEAVGVSPAVEERRRVQFSRLSDLMREVGIAALGDNSPPRLDADLTARALIGSTIELLVAHVRGELTVSTERLADHLVQMYETTAEISSEATK